MGGFFSGLFRANLPLSLTVLTLIAAAVVFGYFCLGRRGAGSAQLLGVALGLAALTVALTTSFGLLNSRAVKATGLWALATGPALFLVSVLLKLLLIYITVVIATGFFRPSRISEFSARLFGVELNYTYAKDLVDEAERNQEKARLQMDIIGELNQTIFTYLAGPFEDFLARAEDKGEAVRQILKDVLLTAYDEYAGSIRIHILPGTSAAIGNLGDRLAALVRLSEDEDEDTVTLRNGAGIAIFHAELGFNTVIILEGLLGYTVSMAEICAAGTLYSAVAGAAGLSSA